MYTEEGLKVRVSRRTGAIVPKPPEVNERRDFKSRSGYIGTYREGIVSNGDGYREGTSTGIIKL